jgi:hypothetical protein
LRVNGKVTCEELLFLLLGVFRHRSEDPDRWLLFLCLVFKLLLWCSICIIFISKLRLFFCILCVLLLCLWRSNSSISCFVKILILLFISWLLWDLWQIVILAIVIVDFLVVIFSSREITFNIFVTWVFLLTLDVINGIR